MDAMYRDLYVHATDERVKLAALDSLVKLHGLITEKKAVAVNVHDQVALNATIRQELLEDDEARAHCLAIAKRPNG